MSWYIFTMDDGLLGEFRNKYCALEELQKRGINWRPASRKGALLHRGLSAYNSDSGKTYYVANTREARKENFIPPHLYKGVSS